MKEQNGLLKKLEEKYQESSWRVNRLSQDALHVKERFINLPLSDHNLSMIHFAVSPKFPGEFRVMLCGGDNGPCRWTEYLLRLAIFMGRIKETFKNVWLIDIDNDCLDDVHYVTLGVRYK